MNFSLVALLSLSSLTAPANDNNTLDVCVACEEHAATRDALCGRCDAEMMAYYSDTYADPEACAVMDGFDTDPRF